MGALQGTPSVSPEHLYGTWLLPEEGCSSRRATTGAGPWRELMLEQGGELREEGAAETKGYELAVTSIPLHCLGEGG